MNTLPDEVVRKIYKYVFQDCLEYIDMYMLKTVCSETKEESSDDIRYQYLRQKLKPINALSLCTRDWYKLLFDLERPTCYYSTIIGISNWYIRRYIGYFDRQLLCGIAYDSIAEPRRLTVHGWRRLKRVENFNV